MSRKRPSSNSFNRPDKSEEVKSNSVFEPCGGKLSGSDVLCFWLLLLIPVVTIFVATVCSLSCFPETIRMIEAFAFYIDTPEFVSGRLAEYPGVTSLFAAWLSQFFGDSTVGVVIEATFIGLMTLLASLVSVCWRRHFNLLLAIVPGAGILMMYVYHINICVEATFFYAGICVVGMLVRVNNRWVLPLGILLLGVLCFWITSFPIMALLMVCLSVLIALDKSIRPRRLWHRVNAMLPLVCIGLTVFAVKLSSSTLGFIPFANRWWHIKGVGDGQMILLLLMVIPLVFMFVPPFRKRILDIVAVSLVSVGTSLYAYGSFSGNESSAVSEEVYRMSSLAERGEWQQLLAEVQTKGQITNTLYLQFALLAEARLGTLSENLFEYPINNPETFCPRFDNTSQSTDFCRIFYRELGLYDDAFRQAFEYGIKVSLQDGFCLASLRHLAEYTVKQGNRQLAEKYFHLLDRTSCNSDFVARQRELLKMSVADTTVPLRSPAFVKAKPFNSEMAYLLDYDDANRAALDYLLCGLLLTKQLEKFKIVLSEFSEVYKGIPLPKAYAEAASMINSLVPGVLGPNIVWSAEYDEKFRQYMQTRNAGGDESGYMGTFWYYYANANIPAVRDWQNAHATS